ncbi:hypothetical protein E1B28_006083 [Marasmius oreades]|uniref:Secreted protein n=1 Tax=Marasmius oreades TaxID=181124 RepID=A0A9P7S504_9AGAR|nr:uncharacterized protein E1B28_006083 [Marasmius oreades]KAG7095318.1 hypothetical protein E1B28_006083 [Marasmius oreades]
MLLHSYLVVLALSILTSAAPISCLQESDSLVARVEMSGSGIDIWSPAQQDMPTRKREAKVIIEVEARTPPHTAVWRRKAEADSEVDLEVRNPPHTAVWRRKVEADSDVDLEVRTPPHTAVWKRKAEVDARPPPFIAA